MRKPRPKRRSPFWTYEEASRTIPYVRRLLATVRESYIACGHLARLSRRLPDAAGVVAAWRRHRDEGVAALEELDRLGVVLLKDLLRGVALFRINVLVEVGGDYTADLLGFLVYRDSRDGIETFAFCPDIYDMDGLLGAERPIPDALRKGATYLTRADVPPPLPLEPVSLDP